MKLSLTNAVAITAVLASSASGQDGCEVQILDGPPGASSRWGRSADATTDLLVVGDLGFNGFDGAAFTFELEGSMWTQSDCLEIPESGAGSAQFGAAVALVPPLMFIGAPHAPGSAGFNGAVYVYRKQPDDTWIYEAKLVSASNTHLFGGSLAAVDGHLLVGAHGTEVDGASGAGTAHVFEWVDGAWVESAVFTHPAPLAYDGFGLDVALTENLAVISAPGRRAPGCQTGQAGTVLFFEYDDEEWELVTEATPAERLGCQVVFGASVDIDSGRIVVGAYDANLQGEVDVYELVGSMWELSERLTSALSVGNGPRFGMSVHLSGDMLVVGAKNDSENGTITGASHVFRHDGRVWIETEKLTASDGANWVGFHVVATAGDWSFHHAYGAAGRIYAFAGLEDRDCNGNGLHDGCDIHLYAAPDLDADGLLDECEQAGDVDGDGLIGFADLLALLAAWGPCPEDCGVWCPGDLDGDCAVGFVDLVQLISHWG